MTHQGHTAWLFGTIHVGTASVDPLDGEAGDELARADKLVLEINVEDSMATNTALLAHAMYGPGDSIDKHLSKAALDRLNKAMTHAGIPLETVASMKPWFIADLLMLKALGEQGYSAEEAAEMKLASYANEHEKPIDELESAEFQFSLFDRMSRTQQEQYLLENLDELESGKAARETEEMFNAWKNADEAALKPLLKEMNDDKGPTTQFIQHEFLEKRNPPMADKIAGMLKTDKDIFVGVGWLHLVGKDGVPELLKRRGYEVTRIY